jgi:hypothetical protein
MRTPSLFLGVAVCAGSIHALETRQTNWTVGQVVQTSSGPVSGHPASVNTDVSEYLGIPFAVPPVGNLRWQPPQLYNGTAPINGTDYVRDSLLFNSPRIMEALPYIHNFCSTEGLHLQVWI